MNDYSDLEIKKHRSYDIITFWNYWCYLVRYILKRKGWLFCLLLKLIFLGDFITFNFWLSKNCFFFVTLFSSFFVLFFFVLKIIIVKCMNFLLNKNCNFNVPITTLMYFFDSRTYYFYTWLCRHFIMQIIVNAF